MAGGGGGGAGGMGGRHVVAVVVGAGSMGKYAGMGVRQAGGGVVVQQRGMLACAPRDPTAQTAAEARGQRSTVHPGNVRHPTTVTARNPGHVCVWWVRWCVMRAAVWRTRSGRGVV